MASVELREIRKSFGTTDILKGISLKVQDGQFVTLVGPSGCGKSTLLRLIAGLESMNSGEVAIDGKIVNEIAPKARDIAMVFQNYALYPHMTVAENMGFSLKLKGMSAQERDSRVRSAADILELEALLERYPRQLSGGQRQRVAMGRAIVRDPKVFLFDEPLSNLDAQLRVSTRGEIKSLHQRLRSTILYVTHDQIEAMTMSDIVVVMDKGVISQAGAPLEIFDNPQNTFVASFIGAPSMNLFPGRIDRDRFVANEAFEFKVDLPAGVPSGTPAICGIRPEHLKLVPRGSVNGFSAIVELVEPTGSETLIVGRNGNLQFSCLARSRLSLAPGDEVTLEPAANSIHLFSEDGSTRLNPACSPE